MTLSDILDAWDVDSQIDETKLDQQTLIQSQIHARWLRRRAHENLRLRKLQEDLKVLRLEKNEFYTMGETAETRERGWRLPAQGRIMVKSEAHSYVDSDPDVVRANLEVAMQAEKVSALDMIMKEIPNRQWLAGRAIEYLKLMAGK